MSNWVFERSSGYAGFRCQKCAVWVYEDQEKKCDCTIMNELPDFQKLPMVIQDYIIAQYQHKKMMEYKYSPDLKQFYKENYDKTKLRLLFITWMDCTKEQMEDLNNCFEKIWPTE